MKRTKLCRIQLNRETLRNLDDRQIAQALGGANTINNTLCVNCPTLHTIACTVCRTC